MLLSSLSQRILILITCCYHERQINTDPNYIFLHGQKQNNTNYIIFELIVSSQVIDKSIHISLSW